MGFLRDVLGEIISIFTFESPASEEEFVLDTQRKLPGLTSDVPPRTGTAPPQPAGEFEGNQAADGNAGKQAADANAGKPDKINKLPVPDDRLAGRTSRTPRGFIRPKKMQAMKVGAGHPARRPEQHLQEASEEIPPPPRDGEKGTSQPEEQPAGSGGESGPSWGGIGDEVKPLARELEANLDAIKQVLHYGLNADVIVREFDIPTCSPTRAAIVFMEGLSSKEIIDWAILQPLMLISNLEEGRDALDVLRLVERKLLPGNQVTRKDNLRGAVEGIIAGTTCLFVDGYDIALEVETKAWEHRGIGRPTAEMVVRGPQEAFNETLKNNVALVRRRMRTPDLVNEMLKVGTVSRVDCAVLYLEGIANPKLVAEVKRRINGIRTDHVQDTGALEQFIEDRPFVLIPQVQSTERPDRMAAFLAEGHVGILLDGSPFGLVAPTTFWSLLHAAEDHFLRWPFGTFLRLVRLLGLAVSVLLPGVYIALTNFHPEMIPTDLLLAIAATRERVPFPTVAEVILMEVSFELIREAGIRVPGVIGPTLGIVGALILGQAAVAATIVSPILVIIVAITALGSFAVPNFNMAFAGRITRFAYVFLAAAFGFYGIAVGLLIQMMVYVNTRSFGVPFMSPVAPFVRSSGDLVLRYPSWAMELRPPFLETEQRVRQPEVSRKWTPSAARDERASGQSRGARERAKPHPNRGK
ncbi:MAG: spore germination protein, partial [Bacillota bacterium]